MRRRAEPACVGSLAVTSNVDLSALDSVVGKQLVGAGRIVHQHDGAADVTGELELSFFEGGVVRLGIAGDGEQVRVHQGAWLDPFAPPLSPENEAFVRASGKDVRLDTVTVPPPLPIGDTLVRYVPIRNRFGTLAGVRLEFVGRAVRFLVECDEAYVMTPEDARFAEWGFTEQGA